MSLRAGAALALSGRYSVPGRQAAAGLRAWAAHSGFEVELVDDRSDPPTTASAVVDLADRVDVLFGPYGSGPARAAAAALAGGDVVMWNHGGAELPRSRTGRIVDVLGPAGEYWRGLGATLIEAAVDPGLVLIAHGTTPFGRAVAAGAERSLAETGHEPLVVLPMSRGAEEIVRTAERAGAEAVVGCGRIEDDLALGGALVGRPWFVGLVVCGIDLAAERLGADAVEGWVGPSQRDPDAPLPDFLSGRVHEYPAVQAAAAGVLAEAALARAGSTAPDAVWEAALSMRETTFLGPFRLDREGRQVGHAPHLVRWAAGRRRAVWSPEP